jgi:hypothetical protein
MSEILVMDGCQVRKRIVIFNSKKNKKWKNILKYHQVLEKQFALIRFSPFLELFRAPFAVQGSLRPIKT